MLAHWHGQQWNASEFARAFGTSEATVRRWLETLEGFYAIRLLRPWHASIAKRQVKSPKVYLRDSGILHALLGIHSPAELRERPQVGASFEGFVVEQAIHASGALSHEAYHWARRRAPNLTYYSFAAIAASASRSSAPSLRSSRARWRLP